jgi:flagellar hook assembly protein FlgD
MVDRFSFEFALEEKAAVQLVIYDLLGKPVRTFPAQACPSGTNRLQWDGRDQSGNILDSGFYLYVLTIGSEQTSGRILCLR